MIIENNEEISTAHHAVWRIAAALWILLICYSSTDSAENAFNQIYRFVTSALFPADTTDEIGAVEDFFWAKKVMHVAMFFTLASLLWKAFYRGQWRSRLRITAIGLTVGIVSESIQFLFPGREPAVRDVILNALSTFVGATVMLRYSDRSKASVQRQSSSAILTKAETQ